MLNSKTAQTIRCKLCSQLGHSSEECPIARKFYKYSPKIGYSFSGSSPPEIFVGRYGYPNVFAGILAPSEYGETERYSMPEIWFRQGFSIQDIMACRSRLIYSRFIVNVKRIQSESNRNFEIMQEMALSSKHVDASFELEKKPSNGLITSSFWPIIGNPALLKQVRLESNPKVERKVESLVNDYDVKATHAVEELYRAGIKVSTIIKILSAGLLGLKRQRKLVPSRWATTATDDIISKLLLEKIKGYPQINNFLLFNSEYLGNHYEILLLPSSWSFEVIEAKMPECVWNRGQELFMASDFEGFNGRKSYASAVTGAYYANRIAVAEYLEKRKRQAACLVLREVRPEYNFPCGVGILREATRAAFEKKPETFSSLEEALERAQSRLRLPIQAFIKRSKLINQFKQPKLTDFFS
ncbi:MAG: hypothetical protein QXE64_00485 [Candidatus Pacearchaeota archaeon]